MDARQLFRTASVFARSQCAPFTLPSNGVINMTDRIVTLTSDAIFTPLCATVSLTGNSLSQEASTPTNTNGLRDAFYASVLPAVYALAASTVISYMLVIMLVITPRTFLSEGAVFLGRQGFTNQASSSVSGIGIGGRPWLQKVAALTVAISLTIATVDTMRVAEMQYNRGTSNAQALDTEVDNSTQLKVIRVISDTFLWFAQAQTLVRLFPRQREKIIIKWTAFALIFLDVIFNVLNSFYYKGTSRPRDFEDALPALSYLFELALGLLYCAWVMYYSLTKKRYAFYHPKMPNMCLVALLSLVSVMVPVVFFIMDISKPSMAIWGDYVRWVGAAAASVVVWEWVERIEALERNEKKDGVLGREVFDGDEMLEVTPASELGASAKKLGRNDGDPGYHGSARGSSGPTWPTVTGIANRYTRPRGTPRDIEANPTQRTKVKHTAEERRRLGAAHQLWPTPPPASATPVSRADTASAESTVYAVRYHPITESTPPIPESTPAALTRNNTQTTTAINESTSTLEPLKTKQSSHDLREGGQVALQILTRANPFRKKGKDPPPEISAQFAKSNESHKVEAPAERLGLRARLENFAATQADKLKENSAKNAQPSEPLPIISIPAPQRRRNNAELAAIAQNDSNEQEVNPFRDIRDDTENDVSRSSTPPRSLRSVQLPGSAPMSPRGSRYSVPTSPRDPYTPTAINPEDLTQRGSLSIIASPQNPHTPTAINPEDLTQRGSLSIIASPQNPPQRTESLPQSPNSVQFTSDSPISGRNDVTQIRGPSEGLTITVIPAPPRRRPSED